MSSWKTASADRNAHVHAGGWRWWWPVAVGVALGVASFDGLEVTETLAAVTVALAASYLVIGGARGTLRGAMTLEVAGLVGFAGLAGAALLAGGRAGAVILAAAWLGHAAWDVAHHRMDLVVPRGWARFCAVYDTFLAVGILAAS